MVPPVKRRALLAALLCVLTPSLAHAQLYSWKDANGRLIISDRPQDPGAKTLAVAYVGSAYGATKPAVATATPLAPLAPPAGILTRRATQYDDLIAEHANRHDLSPDFVRAVIQAESAFNPYAHSPKGAMGLMQLMPATAAEYRVLNAYNPAENIRAGVAYLKSLLTRFNDDVSLALAAYNAGPKAVEKYGNTVPPYKETRNYVTRIRANSGPAAPVHTGPGPIVRTVEIVDGRQVVKYVQKQ
jgi:soluble lytic murein transglycosylase-like protein